MGHKLPGRPGRLLIPLLSLVCLAPAAAQSVPWPTTDWAVGCYAPDEDTWHGEVENPGFASYMELAVSHLNAGECDDSDTSPGAIPMLAAEARRMLREVSVWLESQGFPPPLVRHDSRRNRYEAYVLPPGDEFHPVTACYRGKCLTNRPMYLFQGRPVSDSDPNLLLVRANPVDVAHELFHAVQHGFPGVEATPERSWIMEGTAEAVARTWLKMIEGGDQPLRKRVYSQTLPRQAADREAYDDEVFWRAVAREYTGEANYEFLIPVFDQGLSGDGLAETHRGFQSFAGPAGGGVGIGLPDVFTKVVARHLLEDRFYSRVPALRLSTARHTRDSVTAEGNVTRIAAEAHRVHATVSPGTLAGLTIRFQEDHPDLRLIVDSARFDSPPERNVFRTALRGQAESYEFLVRVVNVAADPTGTADRSYKLVVALARSEECDGQQLWSAIHPDARSILLPPDEYQRQHEPDPGLHPVVSRLQFQGLLNDGGTACTHPLSRAANPNVAPDPDVGQNMKERLANMSPQEMQALGRRIAQEMRGRQTPDALQRALEAQPLADSVGIRGTMIHLFSPNAVHWQRSAPAATQQGGVQALLGSQQQDGPVVPWQHAGVGGWQPNSGGHAIIIIPDVLPADLKEDSTYAAVGVMQYSRGEGVLKRSRRNTSPQSSGVWQGLEGWVEQVLPETGDQPYNFTGTVRIEKKTGASLRGTFSLRGDALYMREECPPNPENLASVNAQCRAEQRRGTVGVSGWFESPYARPAPRSETSGSIPPDQRRSP